MELDVRTGKQVGEERSRERGRAAHSCRDGGGWECYLQGSEGQDRGFNSLPVSAAGMTKLLSLPSGIHIHPSLPPTLILSSHVLSFGFFSLFETQIHVPIQVFSSKLWHVELFFAHNVMFLFFKNSKGGLWFINPLKRPKIFMQALDSWQNGHLHLIDGIN